MPNGVKTILGAGTGLGKSIMVWDHALAHYISLPSEGGHADFAAYSEKEFALASFIKSVKGKDLPVSWEDLLSGRGIRRTHAFFKAVSENSDEELQPDEIFNARHKNNACWQTYQLYTVLYARCAKNLVLEALSYGGIYIAGGIAAKNIPLFEQPEFAQSFYCNEEHHELLQRIPVYIIADYNVSLYGSAEFLRIHDIEKNL
jgi:glucokinase